MCRSMKPSFEMCRNMKPSSSENFMYSNMLFSSFQSFPLNGRAFQDRVGRYSFAAAENKPPGPKLSSVDRNGYQYRFYVVFIADRSGITPNVGGDALENALKYCARPGETFFFFITESSCNFMILCAVVVYGMSISDCGKFAMFNPNHYDDDGKFFKDQKLHTPTSSFREYVIVKYGNHGRWSEYEMKKIGLLKFFFVITRSKYIKTIKLNFASIEIWF
jgi:hypothetical protein